MRMGAPLSCNSGPFLPQWTDTIAADNDGLLSLH